MASDLYPRCPKCGSDMTPRQNKGNGSLFWGCTKYSSGAGCKGTRSIERESSSYLAAAELRGHLPGNQCLLYRSRGWLGEGPRADSGVWAFETLPHEYPEHTPQFSAFLSTLWKHHSRGTRVLLDPGVDAHLKHSEESVRVAFSKIRARAFSFRNWQFSPAESFEKGFVEALLKENPAAESYLCPQFPLSALTPIPIERRMRGDFLLRTKAGLKLIEIDGSQHAQESGRISDAYRDNALRAANIETLRTSAKTIHSGAKEFAKLFPKEGPSLQPEQFCHLVSVALYEAMRFGWIGPENRDPRLAIIASHADAEFVRTAEIAVAGALRHIAALASLYGLTDSVPHHASVKVVPASEAPRLKGDDADFFLSLGDWPSTVDSRRIFLYRDIRVDVDVRLEPPPCKTPQLTPSERACAYFLNLFFRLPNGFREGQYGGITRVLNGQDALVLLPTGHGKSIVYQLASLLRPGPCLYVSPLLSLMDDQRFNLDNRGIDNIGVINSELTPEERSGRQLALTWGQYAFCFISPERMQIPEFRTALQSLLSITPVSCVAIDEVHCVSEWGHNFRVAYLNLGTNCRAHARASDGIAPPLLGLTGTASRAVLSDVKRDLEIPDIDAIISPTSFDRKELEFHIVHCNTRDKHHRIKEVLLDLPKQFNTSAEQFFSPQGRETASGIIFCPHVNKDHGLLQMRHAVAQVIGDAKTALYSGKMPDGLSPTQWKEIKRRDAAKFRKNDSPVMVATKAYGMGIDKPNVRYTIHYGLPASIEDFYQEAGRAGRDGKRAVCTVISSLEGYQISGKLLDPQLSINDVRRDYGRVRDGADDDISRNVFFLLGSFEGADKDLEQIELLLAHFRGDKKDSTVIVPWTLGTEVNLRGKDDTKRLDDANRERIAKAAHRLKVIGCVSDYQTDYQSCQIHLTFAPFDPPAMAEALLGYVANFHSRLALGMKDSVPKYRDDPKGYVLELAELLIAFVYEEIEKSRRRAISEMAQACGDGATNDSLRKRILAYLNPSPFDEKLSQISDAPADTANYEDIFDELMLPKQVEALRGATARMLTDFPDAPGLLILRGASEALSVGGNTLTAAQSFLNAWASGSKHAMSPDDLERATGTALTRLSEINPEAKRSLLIAFFQNARDYRIIKRLSGYAKDPDEKIVLAGALAVSGLAEAPIMYERMRELSR